MCLPGKYFSSIHLAERKGKQKFKRTKSIVCGNNLQGTTVNMREFMTEEYRTRKLQFSMHLSLHEVICIYTKFVKERSFQLGRSVHSWLNQKKAWNISLHSQAAAL